MNEYKHKSEDTNEHKDNDDKSKCTQNEIQKIKIQ